MGERPGALVTAMVRPGSFPNGKAPYISWQQNHISRGTNRGVPPRVKQGWVSDNDVDSCCDETGKDCAHDGKGLLKTETQLELTDALTPCDAASSRSFQSLSRSYSWCRDFHNLVSHVCKLIKCLFSQARESLRVNNLAISR